MGGEKDFLQTNEGGACVPRLTPSAISGLGRVFFPLSGVDTLVQGGMRQDATESRWGGQSKMGRDRFGGCCAWTWKAASFQDYWYLLPGPPHHRHHHHQHRHHRLGAEDMPTAVLQPQSPPPPHIVLQRVAQSLSPASIFGAGAQPSTCDCLP